MSKQKLLNTIAVSVGTATLALAMGACASHKATAGNDYGQVRTEAAAQHNTSSDQAIGTVPTPSNTQNVQSTSGPAVIPGPIKVDNSGAAYTSSSVGSGGNGTNTGLNTNVNIIRPKSKSTVTVTESPTPVAETTTTTVVENSPTPVVTPIVEPTPMASSTIEPTQTPEPTPTPTHHRRMRKD